MNISGKLNRMGIQKKLLFGYGFFVLLPIFVICGFFLQRMVDSTLTYTENQDRMYFEQTVNSVSSLIRKNLALADSAASSYELVDYVSATHDFRPDEIATYMDYNRIYNSYLTKFPITSGSLSQMSIYTTNPTILTDNVFLISQKQNPMDPEIRKELLRAGGNNVLLDPIVLGRDAYLAIGKQIISRETDAVQNLLLIRVSESELSGLIANADQATFVLNENGTVISTNRKAHLGKQAQEVESLQKVLEHKAEAPLREPNSISFYQSVEEASGVRWEIISVVSKEPLLRKTGEVVALCLGLCLISIVGAVAFLLLLSKTLTDRLKLLIRYANGFHGGEDKPDVKMDGQDEITELYRDMSRMMDTINGLINGVYRLDIERKNAEIKALQAQIDPHFIFNTMESVRMRLWKNRDFETSEIIQKFALLMRKSMEWDDDMVTLRQELELVKAYLQIQQFRFGSRICYEIQVDPALYNCRIPKFTLQPLVENAIRHGLEPKQGAGRLEISCEIRETEFSVFVRDDGVGMDSEKMESLSRSTTSLPEQADIGTQNVNRRIQLLFGAAYGLKFQSRLNGGTAVEVRLPLYKEKGTDSKGGSCV